MMRRILVAASAAMLATAASAYIPNRLVEGASTIRVSYGDIDLNAPAGRAHLAHRIRSAAKFLCLNGNGDPLAVERQRIDCYRVAVASGTAQMTAIAN